MAPSAITLPFLIQHLSVSALPSVLNFCPLVGYEVKHIKRKSMFGLISCSTAICASKESSHNRQPSSGLSSDSATDPISYPFLGSYLVQQDNDYKRKTSAANFLRRHCIYKSTEFCINCVPSPSSYILKA